MTAFYPVFLDLRGRRAVVIGGGAVAEQKGRGLTAAGAHVTVVSPDLSPGLTDLAARGAIELRRRSYRGGDLAGAWLAIAATDDRAVNEAVWAEAERLGVPLNAVDDLEHCSFIAPAIHREGDITVAVSTGGKSPALAVRLRQRIARLVGRAEARLCELLGELRPELATRVPDAQARTALWYEIVDSDVIDFVRRGDGDRARRGRTVIRLRGGDPFVFGRGAEECEALHAAGVPFQVIPGVTSATAVPAAAGIPVTHRRVASAFAVVAGHECDGRSDLDWDALARVPTLVVLMGLSALPDIVARLRAQGMARDTPVAVIASGTLPEQRSVVGTLDDIADLVARAGLEPPATVVIGEVVRVGVGVGLTHPVPELVSRA